MTRTRTENSTVTCQVLGMMSKAGTTWSGTEGDTSVHWPSNHRPLRPSTRLNIRHLAPGRIVPQTDGAQRSQPVRAMSLLCSIPCAAKSVHQLSRRGLSSARLQQKAPLFARTSQSPPPQLSTGVAPYLKSMYACHKPQVEAACLARLAR